MVMVLKAEAVGSSSAGVVVAFGAHAQVVGVDMAGLHRDPNKHGLIRPQLQQGEGLKCLWQDFTVTRTSTGSRSFSRAKG